MKFETSSRISREQIEAIEQKLRSAAKKTNNPKFFGETETIELVIDPKHPTVEELAGKAGGVTPSGDPTVCAIAYQAAKALCGGDSTCEAIAYAAYLLCLKA